MDTEEMDTYSMPKKQKIGRGQQLMLVKGGQDKWRVKKKNSVEEQQQENLEIDGLQVQEYIFDGKTPSKHASRED